MKFRVEISLLHCSYRKSNPILQDWCYPVTWGKGLKLKGEELQMQKNKLFKRGIQSCSSSHSRDRASTVGSSAVDT